MRAREYGLINRCVEDGVMIGLRSYYRYAEKAPGEEEISRMAEVIAGEVMNQVEEWFIFDEEVNDD